MQFCYFTYIRRPDLRVSVPILPLSKIQCFLDQQHFQKYCRNTAYNIIMDIRNFFTKQTPNANTPKIEDDAPPSKQRNCSDRSGNASSSTPSTSNVTNVSHLSFSDFRSCSPLQTHSPSSSDASATIDPNPATNGMSVQVRHDLDIGNHVNSVQSITSALRHELLTNAYSPPSDYAFRLDSKRSRRFQHSWLQTYQWLAYSPFLRGPVCKVCVVFPQPVHRGFTGAFISAPCIKYNDFHNCAQKHVSSAWHRQSQEDATRFLNTVLHPERRVDSLLDNAFNPTVSSNRAKLEPILSSIIFCGTHDIALRGKDSKSGNLNDLLDFRIKAGDAILKEHMEKASDNAKYTSPKIQNELINLCEETVRGEIVALANNSVGFSILADETADISGTEQLAIGVRFFDEKNLLIREVFLGFTPLKKVDAETIAETIIDQCNKYGLNLNKLRGQGYDGLQRKWSAGTH